MMVRLSDAAFNALRVSAPTSVGSRPSLEYPLREPGHGQALPLSHLADAADFKSIPERTLQIALELERVPLDLVAMDETFMRTVAAKGFVPGYQRFKRTLDVCTAMGLGLLSLPLLPIVAVAIKLDSPGPVIYRQTRLGKDNVHFSIYKFRTMTNDAEANGAVYAAQHDPRVTRLGKLLRNSRIDEIPQLWNILNGEMSLIGPRPERPENLEILEAAIPCFSTRTVIRPGLTGWAQVNVHYAATIDETSRKVEHDFYYLAFGRPFFDLRIIARTFGAVFGRKGR